MKKNWKRIQKGKLQKDSTDTKPQRASAETASSRTSLPKKTRIIPASTDADVRQWFIK